DAQGGPPAGRERWVAADAEALAVAAEAEPADAMPLPLPQIGGEGHGEGAPDDDTSPVLEGTLRAPWRWEKLLVDSAVIGSRERWRRRLAGLAAELRVRIEELRQEEPDSPRLTVIERDLTSLQHLER